MATIGSFKKNGLEFLGEKDLGLQPSDTGSAGGKETGQKMSHIIVEDGRFRSICAVLIESGFQIPYGDRWADDEAKAKAKAGKRASKTRFTCPDCAANAWGKLDLKIVCGTCMIRMNPAEGS